MAGNAKKGTAGEIKKGQKARRVKVYEGNREGKGATGGDRRTKYLGNGAGEKN